MRDTFLIVDGNSLMHRAFHALPLMDYNGVYTNAVHGFLSMLLRCIRERAPRYCAVAFDEHAPTFRHTEYAEYKAGRAPTPDELRPQFDIIKEILSAMGLGVLRRPRRAAAGQRRYHPVADPQGHLRNRGMHARPRAGAVRRAA